MSSSKSIAAARNRRAGDPPTIGRPGTSIAAQPAFSQQSQSQQGKRNNTTQNSTPNVPVTRAKLTISDAIGLITLRLGRVEQILQTAEHEGVFNGSGVNIPDNAHLIDKSVINSIIKRLDNLEKKEKESVNNQQSSKLENELRDIKDLLMSQMVKYEKFTLESDRKFGEVNDAFVELEKAQEMSNCCNTHVEVVNNEFINDTIIVSNDLKNDIEQELAQPFNLPFQKVEPNTL